MIRRINRKVKSFLGFKYVNEGRFVTVFPDDIFLVSYPKSGNTWLRFLIGNLYYENDPITFVNIEQRVPDIYRNTNKILTRLPRPRILKSHEYFDPRYRKVIYLVRDPRDVAISFYHHQIKFKSLDENYPIEKFLSSFIEGGIDAYGTWGENVGSWLGARSDNENFILLRYEDLLDHPEHELSRLANFISIKRTEASIKRAVELSSADRMRELEKEQAHLWKATRDTRKDRLFVRTARSGNWIKELPSVDVGAIEEIWKEQMIRVGYL